MLTGTHAVSYGDYGPLYANRPRLSSNLRGSGFSIARFPCKPFLLTYFNYDGGLDRFEDYQNRVIGLATRIFPGGIEINKPKLRAIDGKLHLADAIKKGDQSIKGKLCQYVRLT